MTRGRCPSCGATVDIALLDGDEQTTVVLEPQTDAGSDANRYRVVRLRPLTVAALRPGHPGQFVSDHTYECPGHRAGR